MIDKIISHYKITEKLGEGGMGVVYKAEDIRLKRTVALKFLPPELTRDPEAKQRFIHEAQAASAMDHPNICTIHEIDETEDGQLFVVMAYYGGETVQRKIESGPLEPREALDIAIQVAEGLQEAHQKEIVHRDIKSANIMVTTKGQAKIMDFGLAKLAGQVRLTKTGTTVGTVAYMSPEQARGEEVDHRTDIWSLIVVLYEMVTGKLPFKGEYDQAVVYSILNEEPILPSSIRKQIPGYLEQIVIKALEKDPAKRYQNIQEILEELRKPMLSVTASKKQEKSIIVLPFTNMSPDPDQEYFSDGLTEEIITDLSKVHDLLVISRNSAMTFKGTKKKTSEIAREVNVGYVLEGSVRKAGNNIRITAQLIDAVNDTHLWAEKYTGTLDDVFDIQEKVSRSIVDALKIKLSPQEKQKIEERPIDNVQAYELHIKAQYAMLSATEEGFERALQYIQKGLEIIGENEILYTDMGQVYLSYIEFGIHMEESYYKKAEKCAEKVFSLNPDSPHGHYLKGHLNRWRGHIQEGVQDYKKALSFDPNHFYSSFYLSLIYAFSGKGFAARPIVKRLVKNDPLNPLSYFIGGAVELSDGRFDQALDLFHKACELEANPLFRYWYAKGLAYSHRLEEACQLMELIGREASETHWARLSLFFMYAVQGKKAKALEVVTKEFKNMMRGDEYYSIWMAESYALIDEKEDSIEWVEEGVRNHCINYPFLNQHDSFLENIRSEERFKKLMTRVKYEWEHFEV